MKELELRNAYNKCLLDDEDYEEFKHINCDITKDGYVDFYVKNDTIKLHRYIMKIKDKNLVIDHIDGNPLNNQKYNLRICTKLDNTRNRRKYLSNTSAKKYDESAIKYFGEFAYTNFPKENYTTGEKNA